MNTKQVAYNKTHCCTQKEAANPFDCAVSTSRLPFFKVGFQKMYLGITVSVRSSYTKTFYTTLTK